MRNKPVEFNTFSGIDNTVPRHRLPETFLADAVNVDITSAKTIKTRPGKEALAVITNGNSLTGCAGKMFLTIANALHTVTDVSPFTTTTLRSGLSSQDRMAFTDINGEVWWSNGVDKGRCSASNTDEPWSLPKPSAPTLSATTGTLPKGRYRVSIVHRMANGEESPASAPVAIDLATTGGVSVALPSAPSGATHTLIFCTSSSGVFLLHSTVSAATGTVVVSTDSTGRPLGESYKLDVLPSGRILALFNGRLLSASGSVLSISEPYRFGVYDPLAGRVPFPSDITVVAPLKDGVFVVADKVYWLAGADNAEWVPVPKSQGTAVYGTQFELAEAKQVGWFGEFGLVIGTNDGSIAHPTHNHFSAPMAASGFVLVKREDGDVRILISLDDTAAYTSRAAKEFNDHLADYHADTNALSILINVESPGVTRYAGFTTKGMAEFDGRYYVLDATGFCLMAGSDDHSTPIRWMVALGKLGSWSSLLKSLPAIYLGAMCADRVRCDIVTENNSYSYFARTDSPDRAEVIRIDPGKGLRETWFDIRLVGEGVQIELSSASLLVVDKSRRI